MNELIHLTDALAPILERRGQVMTTAESCTGGWIAKALTDRAGSSAWFEYGFVTYSNTAKTQLLGVDPTLLEQHGAVSDAVVCAMARGALRRSSADWSVAVSGIAGPGGGSADKPVGTVWLAWGQRFQDGIQLDSQHQVFGGDRDAVRRQTVVMALSGMLDRVRLKDE